MRQKKAKFIRKLAKFNVHDEREYRDVPVRKDQAGNVVAVVRHSTGARRTYQIMKKG